MLKSSSGGRGVHTYLYVLLPIPDLSGKTSRLLVQGTFFKELVLLDCELPMCFSDILIRLWWDKIAFSQVS